MKNMEASLLGINGIYNLTGAQAKAIKNAIRVAADSLRADIINKIKNEI